MRSQSMRLLPSLAHTAWNTAQHRCWVWSTKNASIMSKDFAHVHVARDPLNAVDGVQIALGPCLVEGEERRRFEGKHGKGRT